jgi:hypothetical protein
MRVSTRTHGIIDYATASALLALPRLLRGATGRSRAALSVAGGGILTTALLTDYELGARRRVPMPLHLGLDAATGAALLASPWLLGSRRDGLASWLPHVLAGAGELAAAALTDRAPGDRGDTAPAPDAGIAPAPDGSTGTPDAAAAPPPPRRAPGSHPGSPHPRSRRPGRR